MGEPIKDPSFVTTWGNTIAYVAMGILTSVGTVTAYAWNLVRRLERTEALAVDLAATVKDGMKNLDGRLSQHEDEDYHEFSLLQEKLDRIPEPLSALSEAATWIKLSISELKTSIKNIEDDHKFAHERIKMHDLNNAANNVQLHKEALEVIKEREERINELEAQVASLTQQE